MRAIIYVRQSHAKDRENTVSPQTQEEACRALPAVSSCDSIEVYRDLDISGKSVAKRPSFQRLLERLLQDPPDVIAAYDQSRAFRNTTEALEFYALMERLPLLQVVFVHGALDRSPVGEFTYTNLAAAHTMERRMTGAKIAATYAHLNAAGLPTGMPPFGYRREGREFVIEAEEAAVVIRIFDLALEGRSTYRIAELLNAEGILKPRARTAFGWLPDTVTDILRNPAYIAVTGSKGRAKGKPRGDLIAARWEPIVPRATWDRVQEVLGQRQVRRGSVPRLHTYARLLRCQRCGEDLRAHFDTNHGKAPYVIYQCRKDVAPRCPEPRVREDTLDAWVEAFLDSLDDEEQVEIAIERARREPRQGKKQPVEGVEEALKRLTKVYVMGHIDEAEYVSRQRDLEALRDELLRSEPPANLPEAIRGSAESWRRGTPQGRRKILGVFFERFYVRGGRLVAYVARREYRAEVEALADLTGVHPYGGKGGNLTPDTEAIAASG